MSICRLINGKPDNCLLDVLFNTILDAGLFPADLLKNQLSTIIVELIEAVEAVSRISNYLAGLRDIIQCRG